MKRSVLAFSFPLLFGVGCAVGFDPDPIPEPEPEPSDIDQVGTVSREAVFNTVENGWARVERWGDSNPLFQEEDYPPDGRGNQEGQRLVFFDSPQPHASKFLLYHAPGFDKNPEAVPVLLVHGANDHPDRAWANPNGLGSFGCGALQCPTTGLMQQLSQQGLKVFAIGFPHKQGDNFFWSEQIHDAIQIIKAKTGSDVVDVVGWSKGVTASRLYAASLTAKGGTPYQGDIRRLILLGGPNGGFDYIFRYGTSHNAGIAPEFGGAINAPMPHTEILVFGAFVEHNELSIFTTAEGNFFPGQKQMLARWDNIFPIPTFSQDFFTTYFGGQGFISSGLGIDVAMEQGSLIAATQSVDADESIETFLLCGSAQTIPGIPNEISGPSDGVVFIDSCFDDTGLPNVADTALLFVNHLQLGWESEPMAQVAEWLLQ